MRAGIIIPTPELQKRLLDVIFSDTYSKLHNSHYSVIANPFNSRYQNCTEHLLDVINAAIYKTDDIDMLKLNASRYYQAQEVKVGPIKLLFGSLFMSDVSVSDHSGPIATSTFTTIKQYLQKYKLVDSVFTVVPESG